MDINTTQIQITIGRYNFLQVKKLYEFYKNQAEIDGVAFYLYYLDPAINILGNLISFCDIDENYIEKITPFPFDKDKKYIISQLNDLIDINLENLHKYLRTEDEIKKDITEAKKNKCIK